MERLTKNYLGCNQIKGCSNGTCEEICKEVLDCGVCPISKAIDKLAEYEQAEEDGLLIRLPVAEGTPVHCIGSCGEICDDYETDCEVCGEHKVVFCTNFDRNLVEHFGETVFLTEAEAEHALAKMKGEM